MKKCVILIILLQFCFTLFSQRQKPSPARKQLRKTTVNFTLGCMAYAGAAYCTWNAYESHYSFYFRYSRGYNYDIPAYRKEFRTQMLLSIGLAGTGIVFHGCSLYHFAKYREAMDKKITYRIAPSGVSISYALR